MSSACIVRANHLGSVHSKITADRDTTVQHDSFPSRNQTQLHRHRWLATENVSWRLLHFHWLAVCRSNPALRCRWFLFSDAVLGELRTARVFGKHKATEKRLQNVSCIPLRLIWAFALERTATFKSVFLSFFCLDYYEIAHLFCNASFQIVLHREELWCLLHVSWCFSTENACVWVYTITRNRSSGWTHILGENVGCRSFKHLAREGCVSESKRMMVWLMPHHLIQINRRGEPR